MHSHGPFFKQTTDFSYWAIEHTLFIANFFYFWPTVATQNFSATHLQVEMVRASNFSSWAESSQRPLELSWVEPNSNKKCSESSRARPWSSWVESSQEKNDPTKNTPILANHKMQYHPLYNRSCRPLYRY